MKSNNSIPIHRQKKRSSRNWLTLCLALLCVLAVGLGTLSVYAVLTLHEQRHVSEVQAQQITDLEKQLQDVQSDLSLAQDALTQKQTELEQKQAALEAEQAAASSSLAEKDKTIQEQEKTISELKEQIAKKGTGTTASKTTKKTTANTVNSSTKEWNKYEKQKIVALTFDDGPGPYTERLLDGLKERGVRATFFVLGSRVNDYPDLLRRMDKEGHEIGNHSQNHKQLTKLSAAGIKSEMSACATRVKKIVGHEPTVMRCPYGSYNKKVCNYAKGKGIPIVHWDVDTLDWKNKNADTILKLAFSKDGISDGSIVLMHDIHSPTVDATFRMVDKLKKQGYVFVTTSELLHARHSKVEAGKVYYEG